MIILIDAEKASDKIQNLFITKNSTNDVEKDYIST